MTPVTLLRGHFISCPSQNCGYFFPHTYVMYSSFFYFKQNYVAVGDKNIKIYR